MACAYTAGELNTILFLKEDQYGITPKTNQTTSKPFKFGPETLTLQRTDDIHQYSGYLPGNRSFDPTSSVSQGYDAAFNLTANERLRADFLDPLIIGVLGMESGTEALRSLPSYSIIHSLGTVYKDNLVQILYNGCKIDTLTVTANRPKAVLEFSASILARYAERIVGNKVSKLQAATLDIPSAETKANGPLVQWTSGVELNGVKVYPRSWSFSVNNDLDRENDIALGADGKTYDVTSCVPEGRRTIEGTMSLWLKDYDLIDAQLENRYIDQWKIGFGGKTLTFVNGRYKPNNLPQHGQDKMSIDIQMSFQGAVLS